MFTAFKKLFRRICVLMTSRRTGTVTVTGALRTKITRGATGRSAVHSDDNNPTDTAILQELIESYVEKSSNDLIRILRRHVRQFSGILKGESVACYRGINVNQESKLKGMVIGPSCCPGDNRYSIAGEQCLYLCVESIGIGFELDAEEWLEQEYSVPIGELRIADLSISSPLLINTLSLTFMMAEEGKTNSGYPIEKRLCEKGLSKYSFSQLLSSLFKEAQWDGILVPGVHGKPSVNYNNLGIFQPASRMWKNWTIGTYQRRKR